MFLSLNSVYMTRGGSALLWAIALASITACNGDVKQTQQQINADSVKIELTEAFSSGESKIDVVYMREFNAAIRDHDMEAALYNLAGSYALRSRARGYTNQYGDITADFGLWEKIKEFTQLFWDKPALAKIEDQADHAEFWVGPWSIWSPIRDIIEAVRKIQKASKVK